MEIALLILIFSFGLALEDEIDTQPYYHLTQSSTFLHVCSPSNVLASYELADDTMPCNFMYPSSAVENDYLPKFEASYIESFTALTTITARRCYKLKLKTHCRQKWFSSNEVWHDYEVLDVDRGQCTASNVCKNCAIADKYTAFDCRVWTFGDRSIDVEVVFASDVIVHQNSLGQVFYGGLTTTETVFNLGGDLREKVFFDLVPTVVEVVGTFSMNPSTMELISYDMRRILKYSNRNITFQSKTYAVYDEDHLVEAGVIFSRIAQAEPESPDPSPDQNSEDQASSSSASATDLSLSDYQNYFLQAQINVTNWYLNYLDCRLKRLALTTFQHTIQSLDKSQYINHPSIVNMLDLGPGEYFKQNFVYKSSCMQVAIGQIVARSNCLQYLNGDIVSNVSNSGELVKGDSCCKKLRLNRTHVIQPNHDDTVVIAPMPLISLLEEEDILNYPPRVVTSYGYLKDLILNSSLLNRIEGLNRSEPTKAADSSYTPQSFVDWLMSTSLVKWTLALLVVALIISLFSSLGYLGYRWILSAKPVDTSDPQEVLDRGHTTTPEEKPTRFSFRLS